MTFFLETNNSTPALIPIQVRRPAITKDVYWLGLTPGPSGPEDALLSLNAFGAIPSAPGDLLYNVLHDSTALEHDAFACNALNETDPLDGNLALCQLSTLDPASLGRAYLEGLSLLGPLELEIRVAGLAGRTPVRLFADLRYTYEAP